MFLSSGLLVLYFMKYAFHRVEDELNQFLNFCFPFAVQTTNEKSLLMVASQVKISMIEEVAES